MDLKVYYGKMREIEAGISEADVVVVSVETADGGVAGVRSEVPKRVAARGVVEGRVRLATAKEAKEFRDQQAEAKRMLEEMAALSRVQLTVVPTSDLNRLKAAAKPAKD
jgi:hypothetical protein